MLNKTQIEDGYAQLWVIPPNDRYEDELRRAQEEARELTMGFGLDIWSLKPAEDRLLADHGNGIGKGDGGCPPKPHTASPSASAIPKMTVGAGMVHPHQPHRNLTHRRPSSVSLQPTQFHRETSATGTTTDARVRCNFV